jgi:hypothetical protein
MEHPTKVGRMSNDAIKSRAIISGGYQYQINAGLLLLADWLDDPGRYNSVIFECDDPAIAAGLDDIVAESAEDGSLHLTQVKLTVDSSDDDYALSWDWLLSTKKGKSLLQKWSSSLQRTGVDRVSKASLFTNRRPDREFEGVLDSERKVTLSKITPDVRKMIDAQLDPESISLFFSLFQFDHSKQDYDAIGTLLIDRFVPNHGLIQGYHALRVNAQDWAVRKNFPPPDGKITIELVRGILSAVRSAPLQQDFRIPKSYQPPDKPFLKSFHGRIVSGNEQVLVLSGSPGQGKSTFLSFYCSALSKRKIPYIRHHYFLTLGDPSDRFSLHEVSNSLMAQMESRHFEFIQNLPSGGENLRVWIETCAAGYAKQGKRFVVVIDGLDHVWRENARDKRPLDSLFRQLFPPIQNVTLLLGTQQVPDEQLPSHLQLHAQESQWIELPRMSMTAVGHWLEAQLSAGRFELMHDSPQRHTELLFEVTEAFHQVTSGHPLHLTYTFEHLSTEKRRLMRDDVLECDPCPSGDIRKYYSTLWNRLSFSGKDALHLATAAEFIWPTNGLGECTNVPASDIRKEIGFLFYNSEVGIMPFHGSLLAFVSELQEHDDRIAALLPRVALWLEQSAPPYLQWAWLWIINSRVGKSGDLEDLPNRQWMLESLARGYPVDQVLRILRLAGQSCLINLKLPRAVELRLLTDRLEYGSNHQFDSPERLHRCTFELNDDKYALQTLAADLSTLSILDLYAVGQQYLSLNRPIDASECKEEIRLPMNERIELGGMKEDDYERSSRAFLDLSASTMDFDAASVVSQWRKRSLRHLGLFSYFLRRLACKKDPLRLLEIAARPMPHRMRYTVEGASMRAACYAGAAIETDSRFKRFNRNPLVGIWCILRGADVPTLKVGKLVIPPRNTEYRPPFDYVQSFFAHFFFFVLFESLKVKGNDPVITKPECTTREWAKRGIDALYEAAIDAAKAIEKGGFPDPAIVYRVVPPLSGLPEHEEFQDYKSLRRAMLDITRDLALFGQARRPNGYLTRQELTTIQQSKNFVFDDWAEEYLIDGMQILETNTAEDLIRRESERQRKTFSEFGERAESALLLCDLALFCDIRSTAREMLVRAMRCICGYGQRKDIALAVFMDSLDEVAGSDRAFTIGCLRRIAPIIDSILETTDGKETRHTRIQLADFLLQFMPNQFPTYLKHLFRDGAWHVADSVTAKLIEFAKDSSTAFGIASYGVFEEESTKRLQKLAESTDSVVSSNARRSLLESAELYGLEPAVTQPVAHAPVANDSDLSIAEKVDVSQFAPDQLSELLAYEAEPGQIVRRAESLEAWAKYWAQEGRGAAILASIKNASNNSALRLDGDKVLDLAFEISLSLEGPLKAYDWLVSSQIQNSGWSVFYSEDRAKRRFELVQKYYRDEWENFLVDSARTRYQDDDSGPFVPTERLVDFLVIIEKQDLAREIVAAMLKSLEEDFADQPLRFPGWLGERAA